MTLKGFALKVRARWRQLTSASGPRRRKAESIMTRMDRVQLANVAAVERNKAELRAFVNATLDRVEKIERDKEEGLPG